METLQHRQIGRLIDSDIPVNKKLGLRSENLRVVKIQRTCVHDGPGLRTTVFFRGCNLRCAWCQNPEARLFRDEAGVDTLSPMADILETVLRDRDYFARTGGGVTLSGGDPLLQNSTGLVRLLKALKKERIHVAVETSLHVPWKTVAAVIPFVDLFLVDLKAMGDEALHERCTGHGSALIHGNIRKLLAKKSLVKFRMVMVPGFNDSEEVIDATAKFLKQVGRPRIELLKYHSMYEEKARRLGLMQGGLGITHEESLMSVKRAVDLFRASGVEADCLELDDSRRRGKFTQRVYNIQKAIRDSGHALCFESSRLKTKYYRKHGFKKSAHIHRAERLAYVLKNKEIIIYPGELLAGNFTSKRKAGQVWEEHYGTLFVSILHQIHRQTPVPFNCSFREKMAFYFYIFPFWISRGLLGRVNRRFRDFILTLSRSSEMSTGFNNNMAAIAHFIVNFERLLELGTTGMKAEIAAIRKGQPGDKQDFYEGLAITLDALENFAERYAGKLAQLARTETDPERRLELEEMAAVCAWSPKNPPRTFHEALQSMLFLHVALCIESYENAVSFGRLDQILYPYFKRDAKAGIITYEKAKELLALFILKMDEVILVNDGDTYLGIGRLFETMSTDQALTMGGLGKDGKDAVNDITYMLLDICELQPYAVNMTARIHPKSPAEYMERIAEVYINGAPMPALYNDTVYVDTLLRHYETTIESARNYAIVGCVEPNASDDHFGNTDCANMNVALPFLQALKGESDDLWNFGVTEQLDKIANKLIEFIFRGKNRFSRFVLSRHVARRSRKKVKKASRAYNPPATMDELMTWFQQRLNALAGSILADHQKIEKVIRKKFPTPLASSLSRGGVKRGLDVNEGGAEFNSSGIQAVGITDVADSLHAIQEVVFKSGTYTLREVIDAIDANFEGEKNNYIREALLAVPKFGQDESKEAVMWVNRTLEVYVNALNLVGSDPRGGFYSAGYYALNVSDVYGKRTQALPSGRLAGVPLANSVAPHYGMEQGDLMSALNSVAGVDFVKYAPNGTTVTFTIDSALFQGAEGKRNLAGIIGAFFQKGGMQFQPNVLNREILLEAYENPEKHKYLLVRVAGYCAYFNDLSDDLKKIIINRTCYS